MSHIRIGRHVSIPDNYKNKKLGKEIYDILSRYFQTKIKRKCINKSFYPKTVQIMIGPNTRLTGKNISKFMKSSIISKIHNLCTKNNRALIIHGTYAISLTRPTDQNRQVNNILVRELRNGVLLGAKGVVVHLGGRRMKSLNKELTEKEACDNVVNNVKKVLWTYKEKYKKPLRDCKLLLEISAGQGTDIGYKLDNFIKIMNALKNYSKSVGVCMDTCHMFAAGMVDLRKSVKVLKFWQEFNRRIGVKRIGAIHLNDSATSFGARRDCHKEIGCGYIGNRRLGGSLDGFQTLLTKAKGLNIPLIMETPSGIDCDCIVEPINKKSAKIVTGKFTKKSQNEMKAVVELSDLKRIKLSEVPEVYYTLINYC